MSITLATIGAGLLTGISHPVTTFGLLTANTVMNGIGLKNDSDIKAGISSANSRLAQVQDSLDELQGICAKTCSVDDIHAMFAPVPTTPTPMPAPPTPTPTPTAPVTTPTPVPTPTVPTSPTPTVPPAPMPTEDNNVPPVWAQQLIQHQLQQDAVIKALMDQQNNTTTTPPSSTTVNVTTPTSTTTPSTTISAPTPTPTAPKPVDESALETKIDKLIACVACLAGAIDKSVNAEEPSDGTAGDAEEKKPSVVTTGG